STTWRDRVTSRPGSSVVSSAFRGGRSWQTCRNARLRRIGKGSSHARTTRQPRSVAVPEGPAPSGRHQAPDLRHTRDQREVGGREGGGDRDPPSARRRHTTQGKEGG